MKLSISDPEASKYEWLIIDLDKNEIISSVQSADDDTGEYIKLVVDKNGYFITNKERTEIITEKKIGNIRIIKDTRPDFSKPKITKPRSWLDRLLN